MAGLAALTGACGDDEPVTTPPDTTPPDTTPPDTASPTTGAPAEPTADVRIDYRHEQAGVSFEYRIECGPGAGTVTGEEGQAEVDASAACAALAEPAVVERLVEGPDDEICTEQYGGADVADITGTVSGQDVDTTVDRTNGCGISDWDDLLAPLLPPAIGVVTETTSD